jgi:hypothetical protein
LSYAKPLESLPLTWLRLCPKVIDIAAQSLQARKPFKQADKATDKLGKSAKNLARSFGLAFSTAAVIAYGKKSLKAAVESQAQQQRLAKLYESYCQCKRCANCFP